MKVRKLAVALALAGGLGSGVAHALGLGEIELQSYLNEPMDAEIVLPQSQGVDPGDVFVNIAPERAYQRLGLERHQFLGKLRFDVTTLANGSLVVNVSSREPLREPYLNFLLELTWPNGRLMREYAVLVDPPVYAEESGIAESVRAPSSTSAIQSPSTSSTRSAESVRRQARIEQSGGSGSQSRTFGPTGPSDTLWTIAASVRPDSSLSTQQVMLALQDLNPDAFIGNNINRLKRGEVLRIPTANQIRSRTHTEATQLVAQQNREFEQARRTVDATAAQPASGSGTGEVASGGDELRLLVADDEGDRSQAEGGSAGGDGQLPGGVDAGSAVAMEELESARRENDELNSRVDDLQDQVETLQRLLELKNSQLAEMQQGFSANDEGAAPQDAPVAGSEDAATGQEDAVTDQSETVGEEGELGGEEGLTAAEPGEVAVAGDAEVTGDLADQSAEATAPEAEAEASAGEPETEVTEVPAPVQPAATETQGQPKPVADKGFPGNVMDAIASNTMYQIALGGGLILLLLILLLLARRNANREKAFYEQLNNETEGPDNEAFDLTLEDEPEQGVAGEALDEADTYVAYGRYDQAAQVLENAISREPSRTDLRLKLLSVYADNQDRESFEKQFGEVQALEDEDAIVEANELRARLEEAESMPSIDDLESQLRTGSFGEETDTFDNLEPAESEPVEEPDASEADEDESADLTESELDALENAEADDVLAEDEKKSSDDLIEYDLSGLTLPETEEPETEEATSEESDFSSLEIDLDEEPETKGSVEESFESGSSDLDSLDSLDESFLDELDAELDKVAGEDDELGGSDMEESTLDDLELDVSDEDLALMEEFSDSADSANVAWDGDELSLDDELELEDSFNEGNLLGEIDTSNPEQQVSDLEELEALDDSELDELSSLGSFAEESDDILADEDLPVASDEVQEEAPKTSVTDIDESDLGDDDDFDFLAGTDEAATKLDLARAYIEMGDSDGARDILEEVALEGDDAQKSEAQDLLKNLS